MQPTPPTPPNTPNETGGRVWQGLRRDGRHRAPRCLHGAAPAAGRARARHHALAGELHVGSRPPPHQHTAHQPQHTTTTTPPPQEIFHDGLIPREIAEQICFRMDVYVPPTQLPPPAAAAAGPCVIAACTTAGAHSTFHTMPPHSKPSRRRRPAAAPGQRHPDDRPALQAHQGRGLLLGRLLMRCARGA